ncbi:hypothetical protein OL229_05240 [Neisseriaceae bacterium JH1-16]|nr:hypothetical protein [Neisseriaceae bacterium JH1-16]
MLTSLEWISALKTKTNIQSDYGVSKLLGVDRTTISGFRNKRNFLGLETAMKVASELEIDVSLVWLSAQFERAKSDPEKAMLVRLYVAAKGPQVEENIRKLIDARTLQAA